MTAGAERVLTRRELNRAVLERQLLLERRRLPLPRALERIAGLQAQYAPSMYVGLWSRLAGFRRDQLTQALERRSLVQGTLMRATIHLVAARDYWPFAVGIREVRRGWWLRVHRGKPTAREVSAAAARVRRALERGARTRAELLQLKGIDTDLFNGAGIWLDLVRVPPSGTWDRRRADMYATAQEWLGPSTVTPIEGLQRLIESYLRGFGPAAPADIANWAGMPARPVAAAIDELELRHFRDEDGRLLVDLPRMPLPSPDTHAPVRYLPTWDATLLVHVRATQILPERHRARVFSTKMPQSVPTFTVDGSVAGTWRHERGRVRFEPFGRLARATRAELDDEAERLTTFHA